MSRKDEIYSPALKEKKIPILTLDNKWHRLFTQTNPNKTILRLEEELNDLLKKQGKATTESKDIKRLKKKLMQEIVENAEGTAEGNNQKALKKMEDNTFVKIVLKNLYTMKMEKWIWKILRLY